MLYFLDFMIEIPSENQTGGFYSFIGEHMWIVIYYCMKYIHG